MRQHAAGRLGAFASALVLALGLSGCGEDTPEQEELTLPAEEEAVPRDPALMERTPEGREAAEREAARELERREAENLPPPGESPPER